MPKFTQFHTLFEVIMTQFVLRLLHKHQEVSLTGSNSWHSADKMLQNGANCSNHHLPSLIPNHRFHALL